MNEHQNDTYHCPECGGALIVERGRLRCPEHGLFVAYGPRLAIREPRANGRSSSVAMPWETRREEHRPS